MSRLVLIAALLVASLPQANARGVFRSSHSDLGEPAVSLVRAASATADIGSSQTASKVGFDAWAAGEFDTEDAAEAASEDAADADVEADGQDASEDEADADADADEKMEDEDISEDDAEADESTADEVGETVVDDDDSFAGDETEEEGIADLDGDTSQPIPGAEIPKAPKKWKAQYDHDEKKWKYWKIKSPSKTQTFDKPKGTKMIPNPDAEKAGNGKGKGKKGKKGEKGKKGKKGKKKKKGKKGEEGGDKKEPPPPAWPEAQEIADAGKAKSDKASLAAEAATRKAMASKGPLEGLLASLVSEDAGSDIIHWTQRTIWRNKQTMWRVNRLQPLRSFLPTTTSAPNLTYVAKVCPPFCGNATNATNATAPVAKTNKKKRKGRKGKKGRKAKKGKGKKGKGKKKKKGLLLEEGADEVADDESEDFDVDTEFAGEDDSDEEFVGDEGVHEEENEGDVELPGDDDSDDELGSEGDAMSSAQ